MLIHSVSCVPAEYCGGFLDVKGADDDFLCEDASLVCCHEDQITEPPAKQCSQLASEGYR